jgi:hypothetical protein
MNAMYISLTHGVRRVQGLLVAAALLALILGPSAQPLDAQTSVRLLPQVGAYAPQSELGELRDNGQTMLEAGRRAGSLAWGLALEVGPAREGTSFRLQAAYGTDGDIPVGGLDCESCAARSTLLTTSAAAVLRPIPRLILVQPYFLVGAGIKRYDFRVRDMDTDRWEELFRDQVRPMVQAGVGTEVSLLGLRTQWELNAFMSRYRLGQTPEGASSRGDGDLQTDLFLTLSIPLGG